MDPSLNHPTPCTALTLPAELPVMVLSDCYLFPGCFMPLFIFEQRYRDMLDTVLSGNRMFCIGSRVSKHSDEVLPVTTAGLVHACVKHDDGTSHLILMGLRRVRLLNWVGQEPYRVATVEPLPTKAAPTDVLDRLRCDALGSIPSCPDEAVPAIEALCKDLKRSSDPELVCDILSYHFINHAGTLRSLLMEPCAVRRYEVLIDALRSCR